MSTDYLTLAEAAKAYNTPQPTIRYWIQTGRLRAFRPGRRVLVRRADLDAYFAASEVSPVEAMLPAAKKAGEP